MRIAFLSYLALCALALNPSAPGAIAQAQTPTQAFGDQTPACLEWSDGCVICRRADDDIACSTPGVACLPQKISCTREQAKPAQ